MTESLVSLAVFVIAASATPGPNNMMVMASGAAFGVAASLPHVLGIVFGVAVMVAAVGFGVGGLLSAHPVAEDALTAAAILFLLHIAWRVARADPPGEATAISRPMTFAEAAAFQWVNPKAWATILAAVSLHATGHGSRSAEILTVLAMFAVLGGPCVLFWCAFGRAVARRFAASPRGWRVLNTVMGLLVVGSLVTILA